MFLFPFFVSFLILLFNIFLISSRYTALETSDLSRTDSFPINSVFCVHLFVLIQRFNSVLLHDFSSRTVRTNSLPDLILISDFNPRDLHYREYKKLLLLLSLSFSQPARSQQAESHCSESKVTITATFIRW